MNNLLNNQKILIVGAGGLLGGKLVEHALDQGAEIVAADINIKSMKEKFSSQNKAIENSMLEFVELDITKEIDVKRFFSNYQSITGAANCTYPRNGSYGKHFFDVTLQSFNENLALHLGSSFLFTQQCASYFKKNQTEFSLVNISSIYGVVTPKFDIYENTPMTMPVEYAAIKSAILHLNKYVAAYVDDSKFRINSVSPGGILNNQPDKFLDAYKSNTHGKGMLEAEDVIASILFLLSEQSKYVTGQNVIIDDGFTL